MSKIDLEFICEEFTCSDSLPSNREFIDISDVNDYIWEIYGDRILENLSENISNLSYEKKRAPLKFDYLLPEGNLYESVSHSQNLEYIAKKTDIVYWHPEVMGGRTSNQIFANHVYQITLNEKYDNWEAIEKGNLAMGIETIAPDPDGNLRTWIIKKSENYPNTPPIIFAEPKFTKDICFTNGTLDYTSFKQESKQSGSPWLNAVKRYKNPIKSLLDELCDKYNFGV